MARSSEYGYMDDKELVTRLKSVAFETVCGVLDEQYEGMEDIDSIGKINMINGIVCFMSEIQCDIQQERESNGTADD